MSFDYCRVFFEAGRVRLGAPLEQSELDPPIIDAKGTDCPQGLEENQASGTPWELPI